MFKKITEFWKNYGFTICLVLSISFIFLMWLFYTRKKKNGSFSTVDKIIENLMESNKITKGILKTDNKQYSYENNSQQPQGNKKESRGERECRRILQKIFNKPFPNVRPDFMFNSITGDKLEFDMYDPQLKLVVEYNGQQHYKFTPFFHKTKDSFRNQQYRDKMKKDICKKMGIVLIDVPYTVKIEEIESFLVDKLRKYKYIK